MAWFCERCGDLIVFNSYYCDDCLEEREIKRAIEREVMKLLTITKEKKIKYDISIYKRTEQSNILIKYNADIDFQRAKVNIISKEQSLQNKIYKLEKENIEIGKALKELKIIKNETL